MRSFPNAMFKVELENKHVVLAHISGKLGIRTFPAFPGWTNRRLSSGRSEKSDVPKGTAFCLRTAFEKNKIILAIKSA